MEDKTEELEIDVDDIGTILKSSRLKSKKSLEEISSELCIRKIYLIALEEGDYETLPPIPYGIGYVRTYARYLGLSPERAVKLYKTASMTEDKENEDMIKPQPEVNRSNKWHVIAGLIALVLIYSIWQIYANQSSSKTVSDTIENIAQQEDNITTEDEDNVVIIETEEKEIEETKEDTEDTSEEVQEDKKVEEKEIPINKNAVILSFTGECWVKLQDKNRVYVERVFHNGDVKEIPYVRNMFLSVGVPANIKVIIKGVNKDILATRRKMNIPLDSL